MEATYRKMEVKREERKMEVERGERKAREANISSGGGQLGNTQIQNLRKAREANSSSSGGFVKQDLARSQLV